MKKTKQAYRHKAATKKTSQHKAKINHHHLRIIPWTMAALAAFYLVSLVAIIRTYPEVFFVPSSYAEDRVLSTDDISAEKQALPYVDAIRSKLKSVTGDFEGKVLKEDFSIYFSLSPEYINRIDFFLKHKDSSEITGFPAERKESDKWAGRLKITDLKNGGYYLFSKTKVRFPVIGDWSFETPKIPVTVKKTDAASGSTTSSESGGSQSQTGSSSSDSGSSEKNITDTTTNTSAAQDEDDGKVRITDIAPNHKFLEPRNDASLKGKQAIVGAVPGANEIEYYLVKKGSLTEHYLGKARKTDADRWKLEVNTENIPNGEYKLFPKITNRYGKYKGATITVDVKNETESSIKKDEAKETSSAPSSASSETKADKQKATEVKKEIQEKNEENIAEEKQADSSETIAGQLSQNVDSDRDGISSEEEKRIGTDPDSADSDKDGYLDGDEIKAGNDPLKSAKNESDKIVFESPKEKGEVKNNIVKIESVEMVSQSEEDSKNNETGAQTEKNLQIKGQGLPNSFVTLYIYSETPTIVTVKTDENGNWAYTMDKDIENGQHEAYVAITDNDGHITAKSEPFFFVKTAEAATKASAEEIAMRNTSVIQSPVAASRSKQVAVIGFVILISLFTAIACIGLYLVYHYHHKKGSVVRRDYLMPK